MADLYLAVLTYLVDAGKVTSADVPVSTSAQRHLLHDCAEHPNGHPFRVPVEYRGFYLEAHKSRRQGCRDIAQLAEQLGCTVALPEDAVE